MPSSFRTKLLVEFTDAGEFVVREPFEFLSEVAEAVIHVPVGMTTDFTSVPIGLRNLLSPTGRHGKAAVVHDMLYRFGRIGSRRTNRAEADLVLLEGMQVLEVPGWQQVVIYGGIRLGGWLTWWRYRRAERAR